MKQRTLLTQEEYRKQQRNARWLRTAAVGVPVVFAIAATIAALWKLAQHVH